MLQWDDIRYFLAVARNGSLSAAARSLNVEHSTVSRRVDQLETEIRLRLFDRLPRGWQLTDEGNDLQSRAEAIEESVLGFQRSASGVDPLAGTVRVSAPPLLLSNLILPGLAGFIASHPVITLELIGERWAADLMRAEADIAIRLGRPSEPDLVARSVGEVSYGLYGLEHWTAPPRRDRLYLGFDDSIPDLPQKQWFDEYGREAHFALRSNDMGTLLNAALAGLGIALLPDFLATSYPNLLPIPLDRPAPTRPAFLVMHADIRRSRRVRITADHLIGILTEALGENTRGPS
jgi:DNA-binding transcriptional LysR family regulator